MAVSANIRQLEQAFISPNMIQMDDEMIDGVVTARRTPGLWIKIRPVDPSPALASLSISIDERDLAAVQKLIGEERSQLVPADDEGAVPDDDFVAAQLAVAMKTLRIIANMEEEKREPAESWRQTLFNTIELAQWAVETIKRMEANDGTPSDS